MPRDYLPEPDPVEIHLVRGQAEGGRATYHYLLLRRSAARRLFLCLQRCTTDLGRYGVILKSGYGEPDAGTKAYIAGLLLGGPRRPGAGKKR